MGRIGRLEVDSAGFRASFPDTAFGSGMAVEWTRVAPESGFHSDSAVGILPLAEGREGVYEGIRP